MGKKSQDKGSRWELEYAKYLSSILNVECQRGGNSSQARSVVTSSDVVRTGHSMVTSPDTGKLWVECKSYVSCKINQACEQAIADARANQADMVLVMFHETEPMHGYRLSDAGEIMDKVRHYFALHDFHRDARPRDATLRTAPRQAVLRNIGTGLTDECYVSGAVWSFGPIGSLHAALARDKSTPRGKNDDNADRDPDRAEE